MVHLCFDLSGYEGLGNGSVYHPMPLCQKITTDGSLKMSSVMMTCDTVWRTMTLRGNSVLNVPYRKPDKKAVVFASCDPVRCSVRAKRIMFLDSLRNHRLLEIDA